MRALKTTTQLLLAVLSNSVSASWGTETFISLVQWIRSETHTQEREAVRHSIGTQTDTRPFHLRSGGRKRELDTDRKAHKQYKILYRQTELVRSGTVCRLEIKDKHTLTHSGVTVKLYER